MTRSVPWPRILAEGVAIVVSILLAFGLQAWWETRLSLSEEQEALQGLEAEFALNLVQLDSVVGFHREAAVLVDELTRIPEARLVALPADSLQLFVEAMSRPRGFDPVDARLRGLLETDRLTLFRDQDLADRLVMWTGRLEDARFDLSRLRDSGAEVSGLLARFGGPFRQTPGLRPVTSSDLSVIRGDDEVMQAVRLKLFLADNYRGELETAARLGEELLRLIRANLR